MPKLLISHSTGRRRVPPCGRVIDYRVPHSPFQKLVDNRRQALGWSFREFAAALGELGAAVSHSSLWIWLHCAAGYPAPRNFTARHLAAMAEALSIPETQLQEAYDASRHVFTPMENPVPQPTQDAFELALTIFRNDQRKCVRVSHVVNILERIRAGVPASN